jgi:hypothetical protein
VSFSAWRAARSLSESLLYGDELPSLPGLVVDVRPGEQGHALWLGGTRGAVRDRFGSKFRHWRPLALGDEFSVAVTSERLRIAAEDIPLSAIRRLEPRCRDLSVLDIKRQSGDRLRLWGDHVPELTVILGWLVWGRVIAVPDRSAADAASSA